MPPYVTPNHRAQPFSAPSVPPAHHLPLAPKLPSAHCHRAQTSSAARCPCTPAATGPLATAQPFRTSGRSAFCWPLPSPICCAPATSEPPRTPANHHRRTRRCPRPPPSAVGPVVEPKLSRSRKNIKISFKSRKYRHHQSAYKNKRLDSTRPIQELMEMVLQAKDAMEWTYRAEGAVNLMGKVLRIQKVSRNESEYGNGHSALTKHEHFLWGEVAGIGSALTSEIVEQMYVQQIMCPLLGSEHVDAGIRVLVSREFLEAVENRVLHYRPSWRVDDAKVNPLCDSVLLIADHSVFPLVSGMFKEDFCMSVEIKPKCGFLPTSQFIAEENAVKRRITRFQMHQALRLHQGKVSQISKYDPLDLYSGSKDGVQKAIKSLFLTPQNNFRVFLNGAIVFGGLDAVDSTGCTADQAFDDALRYVILAKNGRHTNYFLELVAEAIFSSGLLNKLLDVQKLDVIDIEGVIHAYYDIISEPCAVCRGKGEKILSGKYSSLHSMPMHESLKIVRDYLISATAKDLSMMISFRSRSDMDQGSSYDVVYLDSTNQSFHYKASFIDLDMKPLKKMEYYYELDQQIVSNYVKRVDNGQEFEDDESSNSD